MVSKVVMPDWHSRGGWGELRYCSMGDDLPETKFQQCFLNRRLDPQ